MTSATVSGLIAFIGILVQLGGTLLLIILYYLLTRHAGRRSYFESWGWSWLALLLALGAISVRYNVVGLLNTELLREAGPTVILLDFVYQFGKLAHFTLLLFGTLQFTRGFQPRRAMLPAMACCLLAAIVSVQASSNLNTTLVWQGVIAATILGICAGSLIELPSPRRTLGTRVTGAAFALVSLLWLVYAIAFGETVVMGEATLPWSLAAKYNSYLDVIGQFLLGFGMVVILLEDARREAEEARAGRLRDVAASETRLAGIIRSATDGIVALDEHAFIRLFNPAAEEIFHCPVREAMGSRFERFVAERARPELARLLGGALLPDGGHSRPVSLTGIRENGTEFSLEVSVAPLRSADTGLRILLLRDITERLRQEQEREQLQQRLAHSLRMEALGRLVSGVAHELNNPLAAILTFSEELLREGCAEDDREGLIVIREQARRTRAIVRDLLSFVRSRTTHPERIETAELLERVVRALTPELERLGVRLRVTWDGVLPAINGEPAGLEQVLTNLVENGAQAAAGGGEVRLHASVREEMLEIAVEDTGPGIPDDVLPRIFEPFFTTKRTGQGTGLGLSVSLGIVEQHGGQLRVENITPGTGARSTVTLPLAVAAAAGAAPALTPASVTEPAASPGLPAGELPPVGARDAETAEPISARRVLIIDDDAPVRSALRRFFERREWQVDEAVDGAPGLAMLLAVKDRASYDVVLSDLKMPGLSGIELHDWLAAARPELLDRLIFATGDTASAEAAAFLSKTRRPVLEKPFELSELSAAVELVLASNPAVTGA
jgi:PAS domain S-box-containing protein